MSNFPSYINKILAKVDVVMEASAPCIREGGDEIGHSSGPLGLATAEDFALIKYFAVTARGFGEGL